MIRNIYIDHHDKYDERQLEVGLSGDVVFLAGGRVNDTYDTHTFEREADQAMAIPVADLVNAVKILAISQNRDDLIAALGTDVDFRPTSV